MRDRIILLTECGSEIGFGHVARCGAIAHAFRAAGREAELWVAADEATRTHLPAGARAVDWYDLPRETAAELQGAAAVLVDSYRAKLPQIERIARINPEIAIIDDWMRLAHRHGIVIDWTVGAEKFAYPKKIPGVRYLLGSKFCTLGREFADSPARVIPTEPRSVLITFGGADVRQLTAPVVALVREQFPALRMEVVVGAAVRDRSFVETLRDERIAFHCACSAARMSALMQQADFAICPGGQTLYELAALGLPPVIVRVADNQTDDIREFGAAGFAVSAGDWDAPEVLAHIARGIRQLWPANERQRRSALGRCCVDGRGGLRLAQACLEHWNTSSTREGVSASVCSPLLQ